jgi:penicillin-binding protein 1A
MAKIHEELPSESFSVPAGIVTATVCSRSGKLPIAGLCDGTLKTEYFAEGTVPEATCDVHYSGQICQYSNLPATEFCPFKVEGVLELTPVEDVSLQSGSAAAAGTTVTTEEVVNEDGSVSTVSSNSNICPHNAEFFANPDYESVVNAQRAEIEQRNAAAAQAAAEAAAAAAQEAQTAQPEEGAQ